MLYYKENLKRLLLIKDNRLIHKSVRDKEIAKWYECEEWIKERRKKKERIKTILKNVEDKKLNFYGLLTIDGQKKNRQEIEKLRDSVRQMLNYNKIDYYIVPELHADGVSYHYHGFVGVLQEQMEVRKNKKGKIIKDKYGNVTYSLKCWNKNIGFSSLVDITKFPETTKKKIVRYCAKYAVKDGVKASSNRKKWVVYRDIIEFKRILGELLQII